MHRQIAGKLTGPVTKWLVLVFWLLAFGVGGALGANLTDVQNNEAASWLPEDAESTRALDAMEPFYDPNTIPTVIAYERKSGLTEEDFAAAEEHAREFAQLDGVQGDVIGPIRSADGQAMQTIVNFNFGANGWMELPETAETLREIAKIEGVDTFITGAGGQAADASAVFEGIDSTLLFATLSVVVVILLFTYRSPVLWLLPLFSAIVGLMVSQGLVYLLAKYADLTVNGQSQAILTILVIGAGTDYALLLVARYREELRRHQDRHEAMAFALHRAAPAILASASTVVVGMLCLIFADMNSTAGLGPVAAVGIAVTFAVMVTLLPALLVIVGRWIFWPKRPSFGSAEPTQTGMWAKVARRIQVRPRAVWVTTSVLLAVACLGFLRLDTGGLATEDSYTTTMESIEGQKMLANHELFDESNDVQVVAKAEHADAVRAALAGLEGLGSPSEPVVQDGVAYLEATVPYDGTSKEAFELVQAVRDAVHDVPDADALVSGWSATALDIKEASNRDNQVIIPLILVMVLLILIARDCLNNGVWGPA